MRKGKPCFRCGRTKEGWRDMIGFSVRGWDDWRDAFDDGQAHVDAELGAVVSRGAFNVKQAWQRKWNGYAHLPHLPRAISYDVDTANHTAEIGPDKTRRQGALGNIIEFGSINNAPIPGGLPAAIAEEPRFERAVAEAGEKGAGG